MFAIPMKHLFSILVALFCAQGTMAGQVLSLQWVSEYGYEFNGQVKDGTPDQHGGYYLLGYYIDTTCFSGQAVLNKTNSAGVIDWTKEFIEDTSCISEILQGIEKVNNKIYLFGQRQEGWMQVVDTGGTMLVQADTGISFDLGAVDNNYKWMFVGPPNNTVHCYDTSSIFQWTMSLPTMNSLSAIKLKCDSEGLNYVFGSTVDLSQSEAASIGLYWFDGNGVFIGDTIINSSTNTDPDYAVDMCFNESNEVFLLSKDGATDGFVINRFDPLMQTVIQSFYLSTTPCIPVSILADTINQFIYVNCKCANGFRILKCDYQLQFLDTIIMDTTITSTDVIAVSPEGFLFHVYRPFGQNRNLYVEIYDQNFDLVESHAYMDTIHSLNPKYIQFDTLGGVFVACNGVDMQGQNSGIVLKFNSAVGFMFAHAHDSQLSLYPNPANESFSINLPAEFSRGIANIYSLSGQLILSKAIVSSNNTIDVELYQEGMYYLEIISDSGEHSTQKIIIQH